MTLMNEAKQLKDLHVLRRPNGDVVAFHARNLQVARLSSEAWDVLNRPWMSDDHQTAHQDEALQSLLDWESSTSDTVQHEKRETGVRALTINVTQVCNLHCKYCAAGGDGSFGDPIKKIVVADTVPALAELIGKVPAGESFRLTFLGGEPLLYPEGIELLAEEAARLAEAGGVKIGFTVVTNGTLFSQKNIDLLKRFKMDVTVSIDGPAEINDARRPTKGGRGVTEQVVEGLRRLLPQKSALGTVMLSGVFGKGNLHLMAAYNFYRQFDVDWFDFTYDHHESTAEINRAFMLEIGKVARHAFETEGEKGLRRIHTFDRYFIALDNQQQTENYCGAGKSFLMMDARQNLYTCPWVVNEPKEVVGHGGKVWGDKLKAYETPLIEKNGCQDCWARFLCGGGCMYIHRQATGDKHRVDQNYCDRTRFLIEQTLMYYEQTRGYEKGESHV